MGVVMYGPLFCGCGNIWTPVLPLLESVMLESVSVVLVMLQSVILVTFIGDTCIVFLHVEVIRFL